ncbi:SDR family NAD(P)-dependent oxidoreductase [Actinoplanes sp. URMC 104]|uniref:SDR family NAD(P)-dependent oxidoreductase n=1 Tax=Actinoplanes sp. URMC 104 TaxID=3423409 RepID=UPI003F1D91F3
MPASELTGKVVVVTGSSSGIGEATARLLHEAGARPVLAARRAERLAALGEELGGALAVPTDVTDPGQVHALVRAALERHGRVDGLVVNAGASFHHRIEDVDPAAYLELLNLNVVSVVTALQAVLPVMREQRAGRIVTVSSGTTRGAMPGVGGYAASKAAVNMLTAVARKEFAADGIDVSLVLPSITATEFGGGRYSSGAPLGDTGVVAHSPEYVGRVILRALRTGEERIDIPFGPEQAELTEPGEPAG